MTENRSDADHWTTPAPTTETGGVAFSTRTPGPSRLRVAAIAGAAAALAIGVVATSLAASPAPSTAGSTNGSGTTGQISPLDALDPLLDESIDLDHGRLGGFRDIAIKSISGSNVTLATDDGWTRTIAVTGSVALTKGGQTIAASGLAVGDQVRLSQTRNADGTYTVDALAVVVPSVRGTVSGVSASGFKVTTRDGSVWTIAINGTTKYQYGTGTGSLSDVKNDSVALVQGTTTGDNALTALTVRVGADRAVGTVTAKSANSITLKTRDGSSVTVHVSASTKYAVAGVATPTLADVAVDMSIGVSGRNQTDGSINADAVVAGPGGRFFNGHGPHGGGFDLWELDPAANGSQG